MASIDKESREEIEGIVEERLLLFSSQVLGHNPGEGRSPREALARVYFWMEQEEKRQTRMGAFVWASVTAIVAGLGSSVLWPIVLAHLR